MHKISFTHRVVNVSPSALWFDRNLNCAIFSFVLRRRWNFMQTKHEQITEEEEKKNEKTYTPSSKNFCLSFFLFRSLASLFLSHHFSLFTIQVDSLFRFLQSVDLFDAATFWLLVCFFVCVESFIMFFIYSGLFSTMFSSIRRSHTEFSDKSMKCAKL